MNMYVYKLKDGVSVDSWDDVDFANDCIVVAVISGDSNRECEWKAAEKYYDTDIYGWTYNDGIEISDDAEYIDEVDC